MPGKESKDRPGDGNKGVGNMEAIYQSRFVRQDFPFAVFCETDENGLYHWHDEVELVLVRSGALEATVPGRSYLLQPGDILLIDSGEVHSLVPQPNAAWLSLRFSPRLIEEQLPENDGIVGYRESFQVCRCSRQWSNEAASEVRQLIGSMYREDKEKRAGWQAAVRGSLYRLLVIAARELPDGDEEPPRRDMQDLNLKKTLSFLAENYTRDISLKECADAIGFNMNYFSRFFRSHTGIHFHQYLTALRLQKAERLLLSTGLSITEIIYQSGFQNAKTFNRVFKNVHGCSPREFRQSKLPGTTPVSASASRKKTPKPVPRSLDTPRETLVRRDA